MTLCPLCGENYAQEWLCEVERGGGEWLARYCYWCERDACAVRLFEPWHDWFDVFAKE